MCIRNKEVKKLLNIIINKFDEIFEATEFEFIINKEAIEKECNELKKYGIGFNTLSSILTDIFYEINDIEVGKSSLNILYENDLILDRKDYLYVDPYDDGIVGVLENGDEEIIPYKQMNLDYIPLIKKSYSRPTLKIDKSKIFKVELDLSLPKKEFLDYVSKIKEAKDIIKTPIDLLIYDSSLMEYIGKENNTSEINRKLDALEDILLDDKTDNSNIKKLKKKLIADKFFIYDYLKARQEQIKQMNNQIIEEYEDKIQNIKNDSEDNKTSRINYLKKELSQDKINTTDTQILEELKEIENIPYGTARRYYDDIRPFIDNCKYKELITGTIN